MKIAISGAVSTGKTTLGKALAESLDVTFIEENLGDIFVLPEGEKTGPQKRAEGFFRTLEAKREQELTQQSFVVDRCPIDLLNFWFGISLHRSVDSDEFLDRCVECLDDYDYLILMPYGVLPLEQKENSPLSKRRMDKWAQLLGSCRIHGFARHYVPSKKIIEVPKEVLAQQERLAYVLGQIKKH